MLVGDFDSMSIDELWALHEALAKALAAKLASQKAILEARLRQLHPGALGAGQPRPNELTGDRRPYPAVIPKYRNPDDPSETWSGRGKQPRWLTALLDAGKQIDEFRIPPSNNPKV